MVRDRDDVRWAPARFHYAFPRLIALAAASRMRSRSNRGSVHLIDRDQNRIESFALSIWIVLTLTSYGAALLSDAVGDVAGWILALLLAPAIVQVPMLAAGAVMTATRAEHADNTATVSAVVITFVLIISVWFALSSLWVRHVARLFIVIVALNGVAALVLLLLRDAVAAVDRARGAAD